MTDPIVIRLQRYSDMIDTSNNHDSVAPAVSLTSQLTIENEDDDELEEYSRQRSRSFMESMQENRPSHARIPSPKPRRKPHKEDIVNVEHRKSNEHRHRSHDRHSSRNNSPLRHSHTSPALTRKCNNDKSVSLDPLLLTRQSASRERSNSDSKFIDLMSSSLLSFSWGGEDVGRTRSSSWNNSTTNCKIENLNFSKNNSDTEKILHTVKQFYLERSDDVVDDETPNHKSSLTDAKTRQKLEMPSMLCVNEEETCKKKTLKMIDALYKQCDSNYNDVESQINVSFLQLSSALNTRKQELLDEAKTISERKKSLLLISRKKCLHCRECKDACNNEPSDEERVSANSSRRNSSSVSSVNNHDELMQCNGILEPWKLVKDSDFQEQSNQNKEPNGDVDIKEKVDQKDKMSCNVFSDVLEECSLTFSFTEEITELFNSIGILKEELSSPQFSYVKDSYNGVAITGETVSFEVHTRDHNGHPTFNKKDNIQIDINDGQHNKVDVIVPNSHNNRRSFTLNGGSLSGISTSYSSSPTSSQSSLDSRFYSPYFTPDKPGKYTIYVKINDVELASSPIIYTVYPKMNLTFDMKSAMYRHEDNIPNMVKFNTDATVAERRKLTLTRRESSEDGDWIRQKGDRSTLLRSNDEIPSLIYAAPMVNGVCAWKLRVTSACASITFSVGVGTRTGIPDLDEHFSCDFSIVKESDVESETKMTPKPSLRRLSSFTRISLTYCVLLNTSERYICVSSENSNDDKKIAIPENVLENHKLYPFISMIHHRDTCLLQVCPRPQITLL